MLEKMRQTLAININDMLLRAMEPSDLIAELIGALEQHAITIRTEAAKSISAENRLRTRVEEGADQLAAELEKATESTIAQKELLNKLEGLLKEAQVRGEQIAAGSSLNDAADAHTGVSKKYGKLEEYLNSL